MLPEKYDAKTLVLGVRGLSVLLGLTVVVGWQLVNLLGGHVSVTSEVGKGSVFRVWLPLTISEQR